MKTTNLEPHMISFFGKHVMDKLLLCVLNLIEKHHTIRPTFVFKNEKAVSNFTYIFSVLCIKYFVSIASVNVYEI